MSGKDKLTDKQKLFATLCGSTGLSLTESYKQAYQAENMSVPSIRKEASRLAAHPLIAPRILEYSKRREAIAHSLALSQGVSDRDKVLTKLRHMMDHAETQDSNKIRAAEALGRTCGLFEDVQIVKTERTSEDILHQLQQKLDQLVPDQTDTDQVH